MATQDGDRISRDSNLIHLPIMYFLPEEVFYSCPTLRTLPRKVRDVIYSEEMMEIVNSDQFMNELKNAVSHIVFPHLGFHGWKEHYSGYFPGWTVSYMTGLWSQLLELEIGWSFNKLFEFSPYEEIPFFETDLINDVMANIVGIGCGYANIQEILDICREMPCDEDFEPGLSRARIDFIRKWYHTRSKVGVMASLESVMENGDRDYYSRVPASSHNLEELAASENFCQRFKQRLSEKDLAILELREDGFTFEEIAERLEYKSHSGVVKRMQAIKKEFLKYQSEQQ